MNIDGTQIHNLEEKIEKNDLNLHLYSKQTSNGFTIKSDVMIYLQIVKDWHKKPIE